jgi:hypothetical protein
MGDAGTERSGQLAGEFSPLLPPHRHGTLDLLLGRMALGGNARPVTKVKSSGVEGFK